MSTDHSSTGDGFDGHGKDTAIAARVRRIEEQLVDAEVVTDEELDTILDRFLAKASPLNGARIVARAWLDDRFRDRMLDDANTAIKEIGLSMGGDRPEQRLKVVANTPVRHNVLVCTLCSCYPLQLLGPSPSWYKSVEYRARVVREPRAVLTEFGLHLPDDVEITVWDSSAESRYMVLPMRPAGTEDRTEDDLASLVTREGLIGTAAV